MKPDTQRYVDGNLTIHLSCKDLLNENETGYFVFDVGKCPSEYNQMRQHFSTIKEYYGQDKTGILLYILAKKK